MNQNECQNCHEILMPEDKVHQYAGINFCSKACCESYCRSQIEHQCSYCAEPLCNFPSVDIVTEGERIFCCTEHRTLYNKAARAADAYDHHYNR